jgi:hypothetical protein
VGRVGAFLAWAVVLFVAWVFLGSLSHVFASAKVAAKHTRNLESLRLLSATVEKYTEAHQGRLPGADWKAQVVKNEPQLGRFINRVEGDWAVGLAAVPGTLNAKIDDLPAETILYVGYRRAVPIDVVKNVSDIGDVEAPEHAPVITVANLFSNGMNSRGESLVRIGWQLGRQHAPGLK